MHDEYFKFLARQDMGACYIQRQICSIAKKTDS